MFEAFLKFIQELLFKNETIDIRDKNFNLLNVLLRLFVVSSFVLNYYLINHFIKLAHRHYTLEVQISKLETIHKECTIDYSKIYKN
jgi:hypothetical protein